MTRLLLALLALVPWHLEQPERSRDADSGHQFVATGLGDQNGRAAGIIFDLLPQSVNVGFERVGGYTGIVAPHFLQ